MRYPDVSIIIPCYNYENYVIDAVYSCLQQDYLGKIEIIVVDDCSTDNSYLKLRNFYKDKVTILQTKINSGYSAAKNLGIRSSNGEYIATLDADDMLTKESIRVRAEYLESHPVIQFVHGLSYIIGEEGGYDYYIKRQGKLNIHKGKKIHAQTVMIRRMVYLMNGLYDETLRSRADNEMWYRLKYVQNLRDEKILDPPLAFYRKHPFSMVEYRKKNPVYNDIMTVRLEELKEMRFYQGVHRENTPWLKK